MLQRVNQIFAIPARHPQGWIFSILAFVTVASLWSAIATEQWLLAAAPAVVLLLWLAIVDYRWIFYLMLACIPVSIEMELPGGFGTDFPSEPLMWMLTLIGLTWFIRHLRSVHSDFLRHPITLLLWLHLAWMLVAVVSSADFMVSFKFYLAKGWYVIVFYFLAARILANEKAHRQFLWWFFASLLFTVLTVLVRHAAKGFAFDEVNYVMGPFYRNHVMYACLQAVFIPIIWYGTYWYKRWSMPWIILVTGILVLLVGINFAYTRAAYVALLAAVGIYWIIRKRWMKYAMIGAFSLFALMATWVATRDNWLEFAPDYQRTVTHKRFESLLEATTKLEDISTMERVYRWVAASYMIRDRPLHGFGPGNFYFYYKKYTVSSFKTYVSDNPERSGIHNYYLMTAVEQGIPGAILFIVLCLFAIFYGEYIYHNTADVRLRRLSLGATLSFCLIVMLMLMNDFVETDKIGSLFFISLAILVNVDLVRVKALR